MSLDPNYPAISDLKKRARRRIPHFAWEYLDSGTGIEDTMRRNRAALDQVMLEPQILKGEVEPNLKTEILGQTFDAPFGIAPVGMSGLMWPNAERLLAQTASGANIPYCMSNVATQAPEHVSQDLNQNGWFQLYAPRDPEIRRDMLTRIKNAGFTTLVLTVDVPVASRRERQLRSGVTNPPKMTPRILSHIATCPTWALGTLRHGAPRMRFLDSYTNQKGAMPSTAHIGYLMRTSPDWDYVDQLRSEWNGPLIVKGVQRPDDAKRLVKAGVDGIWLSNHAGRQFDAGPAVLDSVAPVRAAIGPDVPLVYDSSIEGGLDILRAIALGADFAMLGRAFHYGLGAFAKRGAEHVVHILRDDIKANMGQMGIAKPTDVRDHLI